MSARATFAAAVVVVVGSTSAAADPIIVNINASLRNMDDPVIVTLDAGTWSVTPIGPADGGAYDDWNPWGETSCEDPEGCAQTIPTTVEGWKNSYDVISDSLAAVTVSAAPLTHVPAEPEAEASLEDYWLANGSEPDRYHVDDRAVYASAANALAVIVCELIASSPWRPVLDV